MSNVSLPNNAFQNHLKSIYVPIDYKGRKPHDIYGRLPKMCEFAEAAQRRGDIQGAYNLLKRWIDSVEWLKKKRYGDVENYMTTIQILEIKHRVSRLVQELEKRYDDDKLLEAVDCEQDEGGNRHPSSPYILLSLPETPTEDPVHSNEADEFISCNQVFQQILKSERNMLIIIDIRPEDQYFASRMLCDVCINIPTTEIKLGISAVYLEKYLQKDKHSLELFKRRGHTDTVVLLDWDTTKSSLTNNSQLSTLKKILMLWDHSVKYKRIVILDGGYSEWLIRYPTFVTNPDVRDPSLIDDEAMMDEILDEIQYPDDQSYLDDVETISKVSPLKLNTFKTTDQSNRNVKMDIVDNTLAINRRRKTGIDNAVLMQSKDLVKPSVNYVNENKTIKYNNNSIIPFKNGDFMPIHPKKSTDASPVSTFKKPSFDRSNKPVSLKTNPDARKVLKLMRQLNELAKEKEKLVEDILQFEHSLYNQRSFNKDSGEEKNIHTNIKKLCSELDDREKLYAEAEEELNKLKKKDGSMSFSDADKSEKDKYELSLGTTKHRIKIIAAKREKLHEKSMLNEHKKLSLKQNGSEVYKEPLKHDNSSHTGGLERSYSSPNLLQMRERKLPQVDRSCKPQALRYAENICTNNNTVRNTHFNWGNREERMNPIHGNVHPGITGLKNLGNSCYMNSIIQCLSNTAQLTKYFNDDLYVDDLNKNKENVTQCQVVEEVALVIKALWRGQYKSISPLDLKAAIGQYKMEFESYDQQDSHEFLTFLLDWMHNDLKKESENRNRTSIAAKEWDKAMNCQRSIISDLFFGQLRSTITCAFCNEASTTYETFNSLTMSLPHSSKCTLDDCIERFVSGQKVSGWKCPNCKVPREATKKFDFVKLAPIVVIHLNRFAESGGWLEKRNTAVDFPLTGFNLKAYLVSDNDAPNTPSSYTYSLYAMSNHSGTMDGGHYTAYCKNAMQNKWYKYNDQTVTETNSNQVKSQTASAYLLFYTSYSNEPYPFI